LVLWVVIFWKLIFRDFRRFPWFSPFSSPSSSTSHGGVPSTYDRFRSFTSKTRFLCSTLSFFFFQALLFCLCLGQLLLHRLPPCPFRSAAVVPPPSLYLTPLCRFAGGLFFGSYSHPPRPLALGPHCRYQLQNVLPASPRLIDPFPWSSLIFPGGVWGFFGREHLCLVADLVESSFPRFFRNTCGRLLQTSFFFPMDLWAVCNHRPDPH